MAAASENESEILLGNKQLLGVFAVVAVLLAVAFTGGYMLGKNSADKKAAVNASEMANSDTGMTKTVAPEEPSATKAEDPPVEPAKPDPVHSQKPKPAASEIAQETVLGAPKHPVLPESSPQPGQTFLQVSALTHTQAEATAVVLRKQNFHARIALKPGSTGVYRVLVGPVTDAGDLASTRDSLRKIGFREVIVQRY